MVIRVTERGIQKITTIFPDNSRTSWTPSPASYDYQKIVDRMYSAKRKKPVGKSLLWNGVGFGHSTTLRTGGYVTYETPPYTNIEPVQYHIGLGSLGNNIIFPDMAPRLHSKVKNMKVNFAMALAEYRQTANLFADIASRLARSVRLIRRGDVLGGVSALGGRGKTRASSNWLAFQYGVRPLIGDMQGSLSLLDRASLAKPLIFKVKVRHKESWSETFKINLSPQLQGARAVTQTQHDMWTCYYTVDNSGFKTASSFGFLNPLSLAWELIPYSFVVDWFIGVGDYLESLDTLAGVDEVIVYMGSKFTERHEVTLGNGQAFYEHFATQRTGPQPFPSVTINYSPSLSWERIVSGVALLKQLRSNR